MTAPVALGRQIIAPLIPAFLKRYPDVQIQLDLSDRLAALATEGFDLAIRHVAEVPDTHVASLIGEIRSVLVATPRYLAEHGTPAVPADLERHDCIHYLRRSGAAAWAFRRPGADERVQVPVRGSFAANNSEVLREAALGSVGIALLPDFAGRRCATGHWSRCWAIGGWRGFRRQPVRGPAVYAARAEGGVVVRGVLREALSGRTGHDANLSRCRRSGIPRRMSNLACVMGHRPASRPQPGTEVEQGGYSCPSMRRTSMEFRATVEPYLERRSPCSFQQTRRQKSGKRQLPQRQIASCIRKTGRLVR